MRRHSLPCFEGGRERMERNVNSFVPHREEPVEAEQGALSLYLYRRGERGAIV